MNRRTFVKGAAVSSLSVNAASQSNETRDIIDTHTHFYDPSRPEGVPWPAKGSPLYKKVYPKDFMKVAAPLGVTGTVVVEASSRLEDNQWILDLAKENKCIFGFVGNVDPTIDGWEKHIKRFAANKLFRGIRINKSLGKVSDSKIQKKFRQLAEMDLCIDVNGGLKALESVLVLGKTVPKLRIVIDHLPYNVNERGLAKYKKALNKVKKYPNIFAKVSNVVKKVKGKTISDPAFYKKNLDQLWTAFGEDRVIYGSNWPVSDAYNGSYAEVFKVVNTYFTAKGPEARAKYFAGNSFRAYKWLKR